MHVKRVLGGSKTPALLPPALLDTCRHTSVSMTDRLPLHACLKPYQNEEYTLTRTTRTLLETASMAY